MKLLLLLLLSLPAHAIELGFLGSVHWAHVVDFEGSKLGGISGLSPLPGGRYLAISDDRSLLGPSRAYELEITYGTEQGLRVVPRRVLPLLGQDGLPFPAMALDPEAIVALPGGDFLVSTEGDTRTDPRLPPAVLRMSPGGRELGSLPLPVKFLPEATGTQTRGVRGNAGFESLTLTPTHDSLFAITEAPLVQDGFPSSFEEGSLLRLVQWGGDSGSFTIARELAYPLSPVPLVVEGPNPTGGVGVSEALALDSRRLLVLERSFQWSDTSAGRNNVRLFEATLDGAEDVSGLSSLEERSGLRTVSKRLLLDFDRIIPFLPEEHRAIDNLEAMAWGPRTAEGRRTLVLASDSNFSASQETQFLLLELLEP